MTTTLYGQALCSERQEIRTLTSQRGKYEDPIHCLLNTVSLLDHPSYTALSYVWGDASDRLPIFVDGQEFSATRNLVLALRYIRKSDRDEVLWVDAVCINQDDIDERNSQVRLMGTLYSEAENVLIWLGKADSTTDELIRVVDAGILLPPAADAEDFVHAYTEYAIEFSRIAALFDIIALRPWWSRVWTVQECVLPRKDPMFQCGFGTFSWEKFFDVLFETFRKAQAGVNSLNHWTHARVQEIRKCRDELSGGLSPQELTQKLEAISLLGTVRQHYKATDNLNIVACIAPCLGRQASVAHDYIYGFLGLTTVEERNQVNIDYRQSHWTLYRDFCELAISNAGPEELKLFTVISFRSESEERPSWLLDFSSQRDGAKHTGVYLASPQSFGSLEEVWWSDDGDILMLQGVHIDVIEEVYEIQEDMQDWQKHIVDLLHKVDAYKNTALETSSGPPQQLVDISKSAHITELFLGNIRPASGIDIPDALLHMCWDMIAAHNGPGGTSIDFESATYTTPRADLGGTTFLTIITRLMAQIFVVCGGKKLMISRDGIAGICVPDARPGDHVVCLFGFHMPFVLRPGNGWFRIVGGACLKGLMGWEGIWDARERGGLSDATFRIR